MKNQSTTSSVPDLLGELLVEAQRGWITLEVTHLSAYLIRGQLDLVVDQLKSSSGAHALEDLLADVTARIRTEIAGKKGEAQLGFPGMIPRQLRASAVYLALEALHSRLPGLTLTADQVRAIKDAKEYLRRIARGELTVWAPAQTPSSPIQVVHARVPVTWSPFNSKSNYYNQ